MFVATHPPSFWTGMLSDARFAWGITCLVLALPLALMLRSIWKHRRRLTERSMQLMSRVQNPAPTFALGQRELLELEDTLGQSWLARALQGRSLQSGLCLGTRASSMRALLRDSSGGFAQRSGIFAKSPDASGERDQGFGWAKHGDCLVLGWVDATSQDDQGAQMWSDWLRTHARSWALRKLRYLVLNIDVQDLAKASPSALQALAQTWGERAHLVGLALGRKLPIYIIVQGIERFPDFNHFCDHTPLNAQRQPWGWQCWEEGSIETQDRAIEQKQQDFTQQLMTNALMQGLAHDAGPSSKGLLNFAHAMNAMSIPLMDAIRELLAFRYCSNPIPLRGVFFAGHTKLSPDGTYGQHGIFRHGLLESIHNCSKAPPAALPHLRRRRKRIQQFGLVALSGCVLASCALPWIAAKQNRELQDNMQMVLTDLSKGEPTKVNLQTWAKSLTLDQSIAAIRQARPFGYRFGMAQAPLLEYGSRSLFVSLTLRWGVQPMLMQDALRIRALSQQDKLHPQQAQELRNRLFRYLLLSKKDHRPQPDIQGPVARRLSQSLAGYWSNRYTFESNEQAKKIAQRFVEHLSQTPELRRPRDHHLVEEARHKLTQEDLLADFAQHAINTYDRNHPPLSGETITGSNELQRTIRVSSAFTAKGWNQSLRPRFQNYLDRYLQDAWLFGHDPATQTQLEGNAGPWLATTYANAFEQAWRQALEGLKFRRPFKRLDTRYATMFEHIAEQLKTHTALESLAANDSLGQASSKDPISQLARRFAPVVVFCSTTQASQQDDLRSCQTYLSILRKLENLQGQAGQRGPDMGALDELLLESSKISAAQPEAWRSWFKDTLSAPIQQTKQSAQDELQQEQSATWCDLSNRLHTQLFDRYPFKQDASEEVELSQLSALLHPTRGELWRFFQEHHGQLVELRKDKVRRNEGASQTAIHPRLILQLNAAWRVARTMFHDEAITPRLSLLVRAQATRDISELSLRIDHDVYKQSRNQSRKEPMRLSWPSPSLTSQMRFSIKHPQGDLKIETQGTWSLFRMLESGQSHPLDHPGTFFVTWPLGNQRRDQARITLRVTDGASPFFSYPRRPMLSLFRSRWLQSRPPLFEQQIKCHS